MTRASDSCSKWTSLTIEKYMTQVQSGDKQKKQGMKCEKNIGTLCICWEVWVMKSFAGHASLFLFLLLLFARARVKVDYPPCEYENNKKKSECNKKCGEFDWERVDLMRVRLSVVHSW